ncbi:MAG TPA: hypothetical protein VH186_03630 [Chloroflexia bacterium]|nr:hypothetical protein [Chloroflexia bacterium]
MSADLEGYAYQLDRTGEQPRAYLWYVSMVGHKTAVQAIWAGLVNNPPQNVVLYCESEDEAATKDEEEIDVQKEPGRKPIMVQPAEGQRTGGWNFFKAQLPAACAFQGVLLPQIAFLNSPIARSHKPSPATSPAISEFLLLQPHAAIERTPNSSSGPLPVQDTQLPDLYYIRLNSLVNLPLHPQWAATLWHRALENGEISRLECAGIEAYLCRKPEEELLQQEVADLIRLGKLTCS